MKADFIKATMAMGMLALGANAVDAQQDNRNCAPRAAVLEQLADRFGETRQSIGLVRNNSVVEVFASAETGSWTIIVTAPTGITCLVASGQAFETLAEVAPIPGSDT